LNCRCSAGGRAAGAAHADRVPRCRGDGQVRLFRRHNERAHCAQVRRRGCERVRSEALVACIRQIRYGLPGRPRSRELRVHAEAERRLATGYRVRGRCSHPYHVGALLIGLLIRARYRRLLTTATCEKGMLPDPGRKPLPATPPGTPGDRRFDRLSPPLCEVCGQTNPRVTVRTAWVLYLRCEYCGAVWNVPKPGCELYGT
jgi:hypothetical protein